MQPQRKNNLCLHTPKYAIKSTKSGICHQIFWKDTRLPWHAACCTEAAYAAWTGQKGTENRKDIKADGLGIGLSDGLLADGKAGGLADGLADEFADGLVGGLAEGMTCGLAGGLASWPADGLMGDRAGEMVCR